MGGEAVPADNAEAQSQGADVWRTLEALLRIAGSEFSLRDSCIFKQAFPETYYTMVRTFGDRLQHHFDKNVKLIINSR